MDDKPEVIQLLAKMIQMFFEGYEDGKDTEFILILKDGEVVPCLKNVTVMSNFENKEEIPYTMAMILDMMKQHFVSDKIICNGNDTTH